MQRSPGRLESSFIGLPARIVAPVLLAATLLLPPVATGAQPLSTGTLVVPGQNVYCPRSGKPGTDYTQVILEIADIRVDVQEDDPGGDYEFRLLAEASVYPRSNKPGVKLIPSRAICGVLSGQWYREFDIPDLVMGQYFTFPIKRRLVVYNVPKQSEVLFRLKLNEIDDWTGTDYGALDPTTGAHDLYLIAYPFADFTMIGKDGPRVFPNGVPFGKATTVTGRGDDFWAGVTFNVTLKDQIEIGGAVPAAPAPPAPSARETECRNYALKSVEQNLDAIKGGCGFLPPAWSNNHQAHFDWCMTDQNNVPARAALKDRVAALAACAQGTSPEQVCRAYADRSVTQFNDAKNKNCGFDPPVWSNDWNAHFGWCMLVGGNAATPELAKRDTALAGCGD